MRPITLKNRLNNDRFICDDIKITEIIDGVEYLLVKRLGENRKFLMRKEALEKVDTAEKKSYNKK